MMRQLGSHAFVVRLQTHRPHCSRPACVHDRVHTRFRLPPTSVSTHEKFEPHSLDDEHVREQMLPSSA